MKHFFYIGIAVAAIVLVGLFSAGAMAQVYDGGFGGSIDVTSTDPGPITGWTSIVELLNKAARWMYTIFFIVATMYILLAAYTYLSAGDNASKVEKATKMIKNAVIAIAIALLSSGVALIINNFLNS